MIQCNKLNAGEKKKIATRIVMRLIKTAWNESCELSKPLCECKCANQAGEIMISVGESKKNEFR